MREIAQEAAEALSSGEANAIAAIERGRFKIRNLLAEHMKRVMAHFSGLVLDDLKQWYDIETKATAGAFERYARHFIEKHSLARSKEITRTSVKKLKRILADAIDAGDGTDVIAKRVEVVIGSPGRAAMIARTETHTAATFSMEKQAEASGLPLQREWGSSEDSRTRPTHDDADGQIRAMGVPFNVGFALLMYPGDPAGPPGEIVNCRCVCLYEPDMDKI